MKKLNVSSFLPVIGIAIFVYIIYSTGAKNILDAVKNIKIIYLLAVPFFLIFLIFLKGLKWKLILNMLGIEYSLKRSCEIWCLGFFTGLITPGRVGDIMRAFYVKKEANKNLSEALISVFLDRLIDLLTLLVLFVISLVAFSVIFRTDFSYIIIASILFIVIILAGLFLIKKNFVRRFVSYMVSFFVPKNYSKSILENLSKIYHSFINANYKMYTLAMATLITFFVWFASFIFAYYIALLANVDIPLWFILITIPIITIIEIIPISVSGIGTRDAAIIFLFGFMGISRASSVIFSLLYLIFADWGFAIPGIIAWMKNPLRMKFKKDDSLTEA
ncbi:hypothetical protein CMO89_04430 [Candidatus Woesearchaeota archaeon]|nr:hypothetical protein [Candidatus Woesearchaeota archaeon]|tara:strand:- start:3082 stop:4077 length:996 start_codon:yes stop_codon:yes gene_type:complete